MYIGAFRDIFRTLLTLISVCWTMRNILRFYQVKNVYAKGAAYAFLVLLNIGVGGSNYLWYWSNVEETAAVVIQWQFAFPIWILFVYLFNSVPPILISFLLVTLRNQTARTQKEEEYSWLKFLHLKQPWLIYLLVGQILNTIVFAVCTYIYRYSEILGTDVNYLVFSLVLDLLNLNHESLNLLIAERIASLVKRVVEDSGKISSPQSTTSKVAPKQRPSMAVSSKPVKD
jgi:uncharacterized protein (DUF2062 family)